MILKIYDRILRYLERLKILPKHCSFCGSSNCMKEFSFCVKCRKKLSKYTLQKEGSILYVGKYFDLKNFVIAAKYEQKAYYIQSLLEYIFVYTKRFSKKSEYILWKKKNLLRQKYNDLMVLKSNIGYEYDLSSVDAIVYINSSFLSYLSKGVNLSFYTSCVLQKILQKVYGKNVPVFCITKSFNFELKKLNKVQRKKLVGQKFSSLDIESILSKHNIGKLSRIMIVDDVYTTGATYNFHRRLLFEKGYYNTCCFVLAKD